MRATVVLCDLDDSDERRPGVEVVRVVLGSKEYHLDVCDEHLTVLRGLPAVEGGAGKARPERRSGTKRTTQGGSRRARKATGRVARPSVPAVPDHLTRRQPGSRRDRQEHVAAARDWARAQGKEVAGRGRLPAGLIEEYEASIR